MSKVVLELEREEAENLSTVLTYLTAGLQDRAVSNPTEHRDEAWAYWNGLRNKLTAAMRTHWHVPNPLTAELLEWSDGAIAELQAEQE